MVGGHEVNAFAAVRLFVGFEGWNSGAATRSGVYECLVVIEDVICQQRDVGGVGDENAFKVSVLYFESGDGDVGDTGSGGGGCSIDEEAVGFSRSVDLGRVEGIANDGDGLCDGDLLGVGSLGNVDGVSWGGEGEGGGDGGFTTGFGGVTDAEGCG